MTVKKILPRCTCVTRDGTQCGRRVTDGSNPPICHIHARGTSSPLIPPPDEIDEIKILKRLARDSNPQVRLKAVDLLLDLKAKGEAAPSEAEQTDRFLDALTEEESARLDAILEQLRNLKEEVWTREPHLRPRFSGG
jgi:hypothetical protein